mgnify:CR=1 FL=1
MEKEKQKDEYETQEDNKPEDLTETQDENLDENIDNEKEENSEEEIAQTDDDKSKEEIRALKEEKIRVLAEMENLRKRFDREKIDSIKYGSVNFARDILSPIDNLERALSAINKEDDHPQSIKNLIEGLLMVKKEILNALEKNGITKIDSVNKKFDPNLHQAMMEIEDDQKEPGTIVQEIQKGFTIKDRLLRPSLVGVSKKTSNNVEKDEKNKENLEKK